MLTCFFVGHRPLKELSRKKPHTICWHCDRCGKALGESTYPPNAKLMRRLKVNPSREHLRLVKRA